MAGPVIRRLPAGGAVRRPSPACGRLTSSILCVWFLGVQASGCRTDPGPADISPGPVQPSYRDTSLMCPFLTATPASGSGNLLVSWTTSAGATDYFLEEDYDPSFPQPREVYRGPLNSVDLGQLSVSRPWYFRVRAANRVSTSPWSNIVGFATAATGSPPDAGTRHTGG